MHPEDDHKAARGVVEPLHVPVGRFKWEQALRATEVVHGLRLLVLLTLGTYMDADGGGARPSLKTLAKAAGLSERTVRRHLDTARTDGYLTRERRGHRLGDGNSSSSAYRAVLPYISIELAQPVTPDRLSPSQPVTSDRLSGPDEALNRSEAAPQPVTGAPQPVTGDRLPRSSTDHSSQTKAPLEAAVYVESSERTEERDESGMEQRAGRAAIAAGKLANLWTPIALENVARRLTAGMGLSMTEVPLVLLAGAQHPRIERPSGICAEGFLAELRQGVAGATRRDSIQRQADDELDRLGPDGRAELELYTRDLLLGLEDNPQPPPAVVRARMLKHLHAGWRPVREIRVAS